MIKHAERQHMEGKKKANVLLSRKTSDSITVNAGDTEMHQKAKRNVNN